MKGAVSSWVIFGGVRRKSVDNAYKWGRINRRFMCSLSGKSEDVVIGEAQDTVKVHKLIHAYKTQGHLIADIDPIGQAVQDPFRPPFLDDMVPVLQPSFYDIPCEGESINTQYWIGDQLFPALQGQVHSLGDILGALRKIYCGKIGAQFMHIINPERLAWVDNRMIEMALEKTETACKIENLHLIVHATLFEHYCGSRFSGAKRFSLEGCEALIPGLEALVNQAGKDGIKAIEMGMTHRGRLNVLRNIFRLPAETLLLKFQPYLPDDSEHPNNSDDVRYHLGTSAVRVFEPGTPRERKVELSLAANPSHLESVNGVVIGKTRARQFLMRGTVDEGEADAIFGQEAPRRGSVDYSPTDAARRSSMAVLLHGDASFFLGSVREVLGLSNLRDYTTGGTVHIIINNQIGFTTAPKEGHSSLYCSDVALSINAPVFHVNAEDPEAVTKVFRAAVNYRTKFGMDVVINLWCYRRQGHNELDDPGLTQPLMYQYINKMPILMKRYADQLHFEGIIPEDYLQDESEKVCKEYDETLEEVRKTNKSKKKAAEFLSHWNELGKLSNFTAAHVHRKRDLLLRVNTAVPKELLRSYGRSMFRLPHKNKFKAHETVTKIYEQRLQSIQPHEGKTVRWATAEALAFGSLLVDGFHVRLSGQDVERGTFNQRHAVIYDQFRSKDADEVIYKPWTSLQDSGWHKEDIRRDLVKRQQAAKGNSESESESDRVFHVGPYAFGDCRAQVDALGAKDETHYVGPYEFVRRRRGRPEAPDTNKIERKLEKMTRIDSTREKYVKLSKAALKWKEPVDNTKQLGVMEICNSPLSEEAVLAAETGCSLQSPSMLCIWEAQFGDFANGAQSIIDTFIACGEEKWVRSSGVVLLLPHGYDGQGPDHSSARVERFLQLCDELDEPFPFPEKEELMQLSRVNMHVLNLTTPAQYFHALRRQMLYPVRKPLAIMTPKYLLHHKPCASGLDEMGMGSKFHTVLQDPLFVNADDTLTKNVKRVIICSGKIYYHLIAKRKSESLEEEIAIIRLEQLCPFPFESLLKALSVYTCHNDVETAIDLLWVQEEPKNMGPWTYVEPRIRWTLANMEHLSIANTRSLQESIGRPIKYCGRAPSASPATGSFDLHRLEMNTILKEATTLGDPCPYP